MSGPKAPESWYKHYPVFPKVDLEIAASQDWNRYVESSGAGDRNANSRNRSRAVAAAVGAEQKTEQHHLGRNLMV